MTAVTDHNTDVSYYRGSPNSSIQPTQAQTVSTQELQDKAEWLKKRAELSIDNARKMKNRNQKKSSYIKIA